MCVCELELEDTLLIFIIIFTAAIALSHSIRYLSGAPIWTGFVRYVSTVDCCSAFAHTISAHSQLRMARWRSKAFDNSQYICICSLQSTQQRSAHLRISSAQIKHSAEFSMFVVRSSYDSNRILLIFYVETTVSRCSFWHNCVVDEIVANEYIKISF